MGCLPCTNLQPEVAHLNACYPPSKALLTAGPDYRPLSQDLSKLTYFATNKPSKLAKIGEELDKRVAKETQRSTAGYPKYRASLLISLAILRALLTECKRDIGLFGRWALRVIDRSLDVRVYQRGGLDLEVIGRAAAAFISFTTYTDGASIGVDDPLTRTYLDILNKFGRMATHIDPQEKTDMEQQNRTRLIALAALHGAVTSDALYTSTREFPKQVGVILPPLLENIFEGTMGHLKLETAKIEMDASPSPFFTEFSAKRPINDRRAPSLHAHIPGEKGPSSSDVLSASLRSLHLLVGQCQVTQASHIVDRVGLFLDKHGWQDVERCCWISERLTAWIILQYRFVVPTRLLEVLVDLKDEAPTPKHTSALAMITTILNSGTSLVGLGVSDVLQNLVSLIIRRVHFDPRDALLPPLVQCVSSLGTHIYYADQINDIVEELAIRIAELPTSDKARPEIIRVLIHCITGVMLVADAADEEAETKLNNTTISRTSSRAANEGSLPIHSDKGKAPATGPAPPDTPLEPHRHRPSRRNPIAPEVWQETLPLLCEADYAVRSTYARALILFLETEMPRGATPNKHSQTAVRPTAGDITIYRFCNALNAAIYTLVMSSCLGVGSEEEISTGVSSRASPEVHQVPLNGTSATETTKTGPGSTTTNDANDSRGTPTRGDKEKGVSFNITEPSPTSTPPSAGGNGGTSTPPHKKGFRTSRRPSLPLNRYQSYVNLSSFDNVATPLDFAAALKVLDEIHMIVPIPALLTGTPMLLALDRDAGNELVRRPGDGRAGAWVLERKRAIRELVGIIWRRIGERWGVEEIELVADRGLASLPEPYLVPPLPPYSQTTILPMPEAPISFVQYTIEGESSSATKPLLDPEVIVTVLGSAKVVQSSTRRDEKALKKKFGGKWTVETAIKDSVERFSSANIVPADDPHYDVAHVLMSMNNGSYQSFNGNGSRPGSRSIDVDDLREALGARRDTISTSAAPSLISTIADDHHSSVTSRGGPGSSISTSVAGGGRKPQADVREVLKDIFKDKKRGPSGRHSAIGIAAGGGGSSAPPSPLRVEGKVNGNGAGPGSILQDGEGKAKVNGEGPPVLEPVAGKA